MRPLSWRNLRFVDALMLTSVPLLVALWLVVASVVDYHGRIQFDDYWTRGASVNGLFEARVHAALSLPRALVHDHRITWESRDPSLLNLHVQGKQWDRMWEDPQEGWGQWVGGSLSYGGTVMPVDVRKRGDNSIHFTTPKRTLTVKTPRTEFFKEYRQFGLSVKDVLTATVASGMADRFDLMAPRTTAVPVFLNNRFAGMYRFLEVIDESFLRPLPRMPGNIYRGDAAERGDYFKGLPRGVFQNPYIWDRVSFNDRPSGPGQQLQAFIADVNGTTFEDHLSLMGRVERPELARLMAYYLIMGDPWHADAIHNQFWYEDPSSGLLHPIPWDVRIMELGRNNQRLNPFLQAALRDPYLVDLVLQEVRAYLDAGIEASADSMATALERRFHDEFEFDRLRRGLVPDVGTAGEIRRIVAGNAALLRQWMADDTIAVSISPSAGLTILDIATRGRVGADLAGFSAAGATAPRLYEDRNGNGVLDPADSGVAVTCSQAAGGQDCILRRPEALFPGWDAGGVGIHRGTVHYRFFLTGERRQVVPTLRNRITGAEAAVVPLQPGAVLARTRSFSPWDFPVRAARSHRLSGSIRLDSTLKIAEGDTLIIAPGTDIRLGPDASILSRGLVIARGTAERPIRIRQGDAPHPWGAFSLQGHGADRSELAWVEITGGGGALLDGIEYTGMVNLHRVDGVRLTHVLMADNVRSDDTFHALHASFVLSDSRVLRGNSDAIDLDLSTGEISRNLIERAGGDGIDLMTSTPRIFDNRIVDSHDKGISVGEASAPVIFNNVIAGCARGIEVKDLSRPLILNNTLERNGIGIYQDRKNWRYGGGGWGLIANTIIRGGGADLRSDPYSRVTLAGGVELDSVIGPGGSVLHQEEPKAAPELSWLYRSLGLAAPDGTPGTVARWTPAEAVPPRWGGTFEDDFTSPSDGWTGTGFVNRLEKRNATLVMSVERDAGAIALPVGMDLRNAESPATAVLELATSDITSAEVTFLSPQGDVTRPLPLSSDPALFQLAVVPLPPRQYTGIRISARPRPRIERVVSGGVLDLKPGRLFLHQWQVYPPERELPAPRTVAAGNSP